MHNFSYDNNDKVSVLLSVFNNENTILESLNSILNQTYRNLEVLVIDDGSSDKTLKKIETVKDKRLLIFKNTKNIGLTKSLNLLIAKANGNYIARQDADDVSDKHRIESQIMYLKKYNLDACTTRAYIKNTTKVIPNFSYYLPQKLVVKIKNPFIHGTLLISKSVLNRIGNYNENFIYAQDYKLFTDLLKNDYKIGTIKKSLYCLNMTENISNIKKNEQKYFADCVRKGISPSKID